MTRSTVCNTLSVSTISTSYNHTSNKTNQRKLVWFLWSRSQPARLNVFKNDQDTWDYTNPNLSGNGNIQSLPLPLHCFSSSSPLMPQYGMARVSCLLGCCLWTLLNDFFEPFITMGICAGVQWQHSSDALTLFMHYFSCHKVRARGATSPAADLIYFNFMQGLACYLFNVVMHLPQ